jgi:D-sedoheptulose 7-phosphate isomerase
MKPIDFFADYASRLRSVLSEADWTGVDELAEVIKGCWRRKSRVFLCGNGGSAGNAIHLANDFLYGIAKVSGEGLRVEALSANPAVLTCLANDVGYESVYSEQIAVHGQPGDLLIALSGSGNSPNIVAALEKARDIGMTTCAILGYSGGRCKVLADIPIHFPICDMQISEDLQLVVGHMLMQWLHLQRSEALKPGG